MTKGRLLPWIAQRLAGKSDLQEAFERSEIICARKTTEQLKALWDRDWPPGDIIDGIYLEHVHAELNHRGHGDYCAV